jgi:hypothetical protein
LELSNTHVYMGFDSLEQQLDFTIMAEIDEDEAMEDRERLLANVRA